MKRLFLISLTLILCSAAFAQVDDLYFTPKKQKQIKSSVNDLADTIVFHSGSDRDIDEYNRQFQSLDSILVDTVSIVQNFQSDDSDEYTYTRRMSRFDGFYVPVYSSHWFYNTWYDWYDPWFYPVSYYSWYYNPWYAYPYYYAWHAPWGFYGWNYPYWGGYYGGYYAHHPHRTVVSANNWNRVGGNSPAYRRGSLTNSRVQGTQRQPNYRRTTPAQQRGVSSTPNRNVYTPSGSHGASRGTFGGSRGSFGGAGGGATRSGGGHFGSRR